MQTEIAITGRLDLPRKGDRVFAEPCGSRRHAPLPHKDVAGHSSGAPTYIYATGYKRAADLLAQSILEGVQPYDVIYPIVFLYRHYVELALKSISLDAGSRAGPGGADCNHDLLSLWEGLRGLVAEVWPSVDSDSVAAAGRCIKELHNFDHVATAFRYPVDKKGKEALPRFDSVDLCNLQEVLGRLANFLWCFSEALLQQLEYEADLI